MTPMIHMPITRYPTTSCGSSRASFLLLLAAVVLTGTPALAETDGRRSIEADIGVIGYYGAEYLGGDDNELRAFPIIDIKYAQYFLNGLKGVGIGAEPADGLIIGAGIAYAFGRDQDDADRLEGLGDIDSGARLNLFGSYEIPVESGPLSGNYKASLDLNHQFTGADTGVVAKLGFSRSDLFDRRYLWINSVAANFGSGQFQDTWFGVSQQQSASSGLPQYDTDDVLYSLGAVSRLIFFLTRDLSLITAVGLEKLTGDVADSPIVLEENQISYQLGFSYSL